MLKANKFTSHIYKNDECKQACVEFKLVCIDFDCYSENQAFYKLDRSSARHWFINTFTVCRNQMLLSIQHLDIHGLPN